MRKKQVRCYKALANVYPTVYNYEVYYTVPDGGWFNSLNTCINCGEIFVIDWSNPKTKGLSIYKIAGSYNCPTCNTLLKNSIREYPKNIKLKDGKTGSFIPSNIIPPDDDSLVLSFFEIEMIE